MKAFKLNTVLTVIQISFFVILTTMALYSKADCDKGYFKVGSGYKFDEQTKYTFTDPNTHQVTNYFTTPSKYSARFEFAVECDRLTYGISHHSQWSSGWPKNRVGEPYKTEFFIDYKYEFNL